MESLHSWIIPGKQAWLRQNEAFSIGTITDRNEKNQTVSCKISGTDQEATVAFSDVFECSHTQKEYEDMCNMDVLNEPEILNNLRRRYKEDKIFTKIGPTLIVVNPYKIIEPLFNHKVPP